MQARFIGLAAAVVVAAFGLGTAAAADAAPAAKAKEKVKAKVKFNTLFVTGTNDADTLALRLRAGDSERLEIDAGDDGDADRTFRRARFDRIIVELRDGDDSVRIDEANGAFTDTELTTMDGGDGDDTFAGGSGAETYVGGSGDDSADGNRGNDLGLMGAGDDSFRWDPGDGNDTIEGQDGLDVMDFNGAGGTDTVDMSANGPRLRFFRQPGAVTMDTNDVERVDIDTLGGPDTIVVNDLSGTDVTEVRNDLAAVLGGNAGDGQPDTVIVNGTNGDDTVEVTGAAGEVAASGLQALVRISHAEAANDQLLINTLGGDDTVSAPTLQADSIKLTVDGGSGDDDMFGSRGADVFLGGSGDDDVDGNQGDDVGLMGAGDDSFRWDPGDGSDIVEGQDGDDTLDFNGAGVAENIDVSANGSRVRFFRDVATITMDLNDVEQIDFDALGGPDNVVVNDLSGTDAVEVNVNLAAALGGNTGDGQPDRVTVKGTNGDDTIGVSGGAAGIRVAGLAATTNITNAEGAIDSLVIDTLAGNDTVDPTGLAPGAIQLLIL
jgi:Ca2+-binding RTX toxin-like protein